MRRAEGSQPAIRKSDEKQVRPAGVPQRECRLGKDFALCRGNAWTTSLGLHFNQTEEVSQMALSRRDFLKLCGGSAAALGLSQTYVPEIAHALEKAAAGQPPVIWLAGSACTGGSVSLLNPLDPDIKDVVLKIISLRYHQTVTGA